MPSSSLKALAVKPHRRRRRRLKTVRTLHLSVFHFLVQQPQDWSEGLPLDVLLSIFHRLDDQVQIMMGPDKVCRAWSRAASDEPELWRRIDMRGHADLAYRDLADLDEMAAIAVLRSQGQCRAFWGECAGYNDGFLHLLAHQAPLLQSLMILISCDGISGEGFMEAIQMFPLLEELQLSDCWNLLDMGLLEVVARACPRLKLLRHHRPYWRCTDERDREAMGIAMMHELCSLQLFRNHLTNAGLAAILDNCTRLESLDMRRCYWIDLDDDTMSAKCARIKTKKLYSPNSDDEYGDFEPASPISIWRPRKNPKRWSCLDDLDDYADYYDPWYGLDSHDEAGLEVHGRMLCKSVRRYLNMDWPGIM